MCVYKLPLMTSIFPQEYDYKSLKWGFLQRTSKHYAKHYLIVKSTHIKTSKADTLCENTPSM